MNATPPEANYEYSRGHRAPMGDSSRGTHGSGPRSALTTWVLCGGVLGAALLIVAEFTTLYNERTSTSSAILKSVATGSNHSYAMLPIAILASVLAYAVWRAVNRPALLALGVLGLLALLISLLNDLPDAHRSGLVGSS